MIVEYSHAAGLRLLEPNDFGKFKLVLNSDVPLSQPSINGIVFVDDANVLIDIDAVPALPGAPGDADWRAGFERMIQVARRHGWVEEGSRAIRAHVQRDA